MEETSAPPKAPEPAGLGFTHRQILVTMSGLVIAMLLAMLDNMIVAPALPTIVGDLGGLTHLSWVTTGYILATTIATPIWGKLGDLYGRRTTFLAAIVLFLVGSALCGMAHNMAELISFRAIQGLGAGGLSVGVLSIIGVMIPPRERSKYQGVMMAVMPVAMIGARLSSDSTVSGVPTAAVVEGDSGVVVVGSVGGVVLGPCSAFKLGADRA